MTILLGMWEIFELETEKYAQNELKIYVKCEKVIGHENEK